MRELAADAPVSTLTVAELEELVEQIIERREAKRQAAALSSRRKRVDPDSLEAVRAVRGSARGEHLLERLLAARAEDCARE